MGPLVDVEVGVAVGLLVNVEVVVAEGMPVDVAVAVVVGLLVDVAVGLAVLEGLVVEVAVRVGPPQPVLIMTGKNARCSVIGVRVAVAGGESTVVVTQL